MGSGVATEPEAWAYAPRGGAADLMACREREVLFEGPAGTGKSRAAMEKAYLCAIKYPGARIGFFRKTRASMSETVLRTWEQIVVPPSDPILQGPMRTHRTAYQFPNGSAVIPLGLDKVDRIMSMDLDTAFVFEATELTENDWETILTRIGRNRAMLYRQAVADCNPGPFGHWLNQRAIRGQMSRVLSRHRDNPVWHTGRNWTDAGREYMATLDQLSGHRRVRLKDGKWASAEGIVYPEFDRAIHVVDRFEIPKDWRRIRAMDFGYKNPFCCQWWAINGDDQAILYREVYETGLTGRDAAWMVRDIEPEDMETVGDPADADAREEFMRAGIYVTPANKAVKEGINDVQSRLRDRGDGKPGLLFLRDSLVKRDEKLAAAYRPTCTVDEFESYIWKTGQDGRPVPEEPVKSNDHGMDALRYLCRYLAKPPSTPTVY